jgi:putative Ca2+/H+ antiporter (TMEM165/GDT1 family)
MARRAVGADAPPMAKRVVAVFLWFYVIMGVWNAVAYMTGLSVLFGPVVAAAVAALIVGDPTHRIWTPRT